ncbi:hypothetical protein PBY51_008907 [Eleginops maclovinus]|uniref:Uncharacterized protein n=1 Tax=Eleginops maclovinus TaxID=56733 RepID=A0AAN8AAX1_ELEMC|nr:hypothetical protein PBY51_008907 [Eleginops maclovinus]
MLEKRNLSLPMLRGIRLDLGFRPLTDTTGCGFSPDARLPTRLSASSHHATHLWSCVAVGNTHLVTSRSMIICP